MRDVWRSHYKWTHGVGESPNDFDGGIQQSLELIRAICSWDLALGMMV